MAFLVSLFFSFKSYLFVDIFIYLYKVIIFTSIDTSYLSPTPSKPLLPPNKSLYFLASTPSNLLSFTKATGMSMDVGYLLLHRQLPVAPLIKKNDFFPRSHHLPTAPQLGHGLMSPSQDLSNLSGLAYRGQDVMVSCL